MAKKLFDKKNPCNSCPYRTDTDLAIWSLQEFKDLLDFDKDILGSVYKCHKKDGCVCVGWLMDQVKRDMPSVKLRLSLMNNKVQSSYLDSLSCQVPLYNSVEEMCMANYPDFFTKNRVDMYNRITPNLITDLDDKDVFTFGSNLQGIHGKGAAKTALRWGARRGVGVGKSGQTYAIPTRTFVGFNKLQSLALHDIENYVNRFITYAKSDSDSRYLVTLIGCGNAGYKPAQIAPMFIGALHVNNICLPLEFWKIIDR